MRFPLYWLWWLLQRVGLELSIDVEVRTVALKPLERGQLVNPEDIKEETRIYLKVERR